MPQPSPQQAQQPLEIGKEYPPPGEDAAIEKLRQLHLRIHNAQPGPNLRGEHPKQHGGVWARFRVERDIPEAFRTGLFGNAASYTALVRYSNGRNRDDRQPDVRGMAIKVLIPVDGGAPLQQDFILANHPVFFGRNAQHTFEFLAATASGVSPVQLAMSTHPALVGFTSQVKSSPLALTYWSQTPYKCGDGAVKYLAIPSEAQEGDPVMLHDSPDCLQEAMVEQLTFDKIGAHFDFCVNPQTDAQEMPIEDATIEWKSAPVKLATVSIFPQKFNSPEQMSFVENLHWTPWESLPEHRPLGGINRARQGLYQDSRELRNKTNGIPAPSITGRESF